MRSVRSFMRVRGRILRRVFLATMRFFTRSWSRLRLCNTLLLPSWSSSLFSRGGGDVIWLFRWPFSKTLLLERTYLLVLLAGAMGTSYLLDVLFLRLNGTTESGDKRN